ncbi:MAG: hypothetical protein GXO43_09245 [Crenarchaeota archaeon]|nr:hypothetical protein [Thermoproteota archaeon]
MSRQIYTGSNIVLLNLSGFDLILTPETENFIPEFWHTKKTDDWQYIILPRRSVSFLQVFKILSDNCAGKLCYSRIFFYELRDRPVDLVLEPIDTKTFVIYGSNPSFPRIVRRILANPKYSNTVVFIAKFNETKYERYKRAASIARRIFMELSPVTISRGLGRLLGVKIENISGRMKVTLCVSREGIKSTETMGGVSVDIRSINQCL